MIFHRFSTLNTFPNEEDNAWYPLKPMRESEAGKRMDKGGMENTRTFLDHYSHLCYSQHPSSWIALYVSGHYSTTKGTA